MRKRHLFITIVTMVVATAVAIVSCKKDNENALNTTTLKGYTIQQVADIRQMDDPLTYIKDFKKKLTESKDNEAFELDDAAWHLSCLANLEFCNINVEYDDFQFDTLEMQVNVTDGVILLGDLRTAYEQMCTEIQQFEKGFNHCDQNLYFIKLSIGADGNAKIALMTTFKSDSKYLWNHTWYFTDAMDATIACDTLFCYDSTYAWNTAAVNELTRALNLFEYHEGPIHGSGGIIGECYFPTRYHTFTYLITDPYDSDYYNNSRVFAKKNYSDHLDYNLEFFEMCYCLDSYLGLGYDYISAYPYENPVCWHVTPKSYINPPQSIHYHELKVDYGQLVTINPPGPND